MCARLHSGIDSLDAIWHDACVGNAKREDKTMQTETEMETETQRQIRQMATRYNAFSDAMRDNDYAAQRIWGEMLQEIQKETGVKMVEESILQTLLDYAHSQR